MKSMFITLTEQEKQNKQKRFSRCPTRSALCGSLLIRSFFAIQPDQHREVTWFQELIYVLIARSSRRRPFPSVGYSIFVLTSPPLSHELPQPSMNTSYHPYASRAASIRFPLMLKSQRLPSTQVLYSFL